MSRSISAEEMNTEMAKRISGSIVKSTEKAINFEFWSNKSDKMVKKWIPKSAICSSILIITDDKARFFFQLAKYGHHNFRNGDTAWLELKYWAYRKIILGIDDSFSYRQQADYSDLEINEDQDFRLVHNF